MDKNKLWLSTAFMLCFLVIGIPYWLVPYQQVSLPKTLIGPALLVVIISGLLLRLLSELPFKKIVTTIGVSVPSVVAVRIVWEGIIDPTSHNLWPFEIIIALIVGFSCSLAGTVMGSLFKKKDRIKCFLGSNQRLIRCHR